jgi:hypothetical protein
MVLHCDVCNSTDDVKLVVHDEMLGPADSTDELDDLPTEEYLCGPCRQESEV